MCEREPREPESLPHYTASLFWNSLQWIFDFGGEQNSYSGVWVSKGRQEVDTLPHMEAEKRVDIPFPIASVWPQHNQLHDLVLILEGVKQKEGSVKNFFVVPTVEWRAQCCGDKCSECWSPVTKGWLKAMPVAEVATCHQWCWLWCCLDLASLGLCHSLYLAVLQGLWDVPHNFSTLIFYLSHPESI